MNYKILVFCHPKKIETPRDHFAYDFMMSYVPEEYKESVIFETVDIVGTPDYKTDAFSKSFASEHMMEYDLLFLLDCGGEWLHIQSYENMYVDRINYRDRIVYITSNMLKPGGYIVMGKFMDGMDSDLLHDMIRGFQKKNWNVYLDQEDVGGTQEILSVQRPNLRM